MSESNWAVRVEGWAEDRNLIGGSRPKDPMLKLIEELGELSDAIQKGDLAAAEDAIGDASVVLCIMARQLGLFYPTCQEAAWDQIKDRKGVMVDGVFRKEVTNE
jgi:hypothetical protein